MLLLDDVTLQHFEHVVAGTPVFFGDEQRQPEQVPDDLIARNAFGAGSLHERRDLDERLLGRHDDPLLLPPSKIGPAGPAPPCPVVQQPACVLELKPDAFPPPTPCA